MSRGGVALVAAGTFAAPVAQWLLVWLFARQCGAGGVGQLSLALSVAAPVFVVTSLGLRNMWVTLRVPVAWPVYRRLRLAGSALGAAVLVGVCLALGLPGVLVWLMAWTKVADTVMDLYYGRAQRESQLLLGVLTTAGPVVSVAGLGLGWLVSGEAMGALAGAALARVPALAATVWACRHLPERPGAGGWAGVAALLGGAGAMTVSTAAFSVTSYVPTWLVAGSASATEVGVWAVAAYLLVVASLVGAATQSALLGLLRAGFERGGVGRLHRSARRASTVMLAVSLLGAVVVVLFGDAVLAWLYGPDFVVGVRVLALLALASALVAPGSVWSAVLMVDNAYRALARVTVAALAATVLVGLVLVGAGVPALSAAAGGAVAGAVARSAGSFLVAVRPGPGGRAEPCPAAL